MNKPKDKIVILGSGIALGVYIPALRLRDYLRKYGYNVEVTILEEYFLNERYQKLKNNKKVFHENFRVAKKAHQIPGDMSQNCDEKKVNALINKWQEEKIRRFIIFSGYWVDIINRYEKLIQKTIIVDCFHMDAVLSNSWKVQKDVIFKKNQVWPFSLLNECILTYIPYVNVNPIEKLNNKQIVIHGGGWGMGVFDNNLDCLRESGYDIFRVAYNRDEYMQYLDKYGKAYYMDENWSPWIRADDGELEYPHIYKNGAEKSSLNSMLVESDLIVSKPGGGTLMDSIALGKPIIFLEPLSDYENSNLLLWEKLNLGITIDDWKKEKD